MDKYIMVGADVHEKTMLLKVAEGRNKAEKRSYENTVSGRKAMIAHLMDRARAAGGARVIFAYEASCLGFGLHDLLRENGIDAYVLAPTKIPRSVEHRRRKTDERDAERLLEIVRAYVLAGNELPRVWIPDPETRDDREVVRAWLDACEKLTALKSQVQSLLKRNSIRKPPSCGKGWTKTHWTWLRGLTQRGRETPQGVRIALDTLLRQMEAIRAEIAYLDREVKGLSETRRYAESVSALTAEKGVAVLTAMVFLTELGDLRRFPSRRQIGAFLGIVPSSNESGESGERKGHITHQGPWRVRRILCQAVWARIRTEPQTRTFYERIARRNPKHKKIAVVAAMRHLAILLWHIGRDVQDRTKCLENIAAA